MNKIKKNQLLFRVWDKLYKNYIYPDSPGQQHFILNLRGEFYNLHNGSGGDEYIVEMCIRQKDEEGKLVYIGDIIENVNGQYLIYWDEYIPIKENENILTGVPFFGKVIGNMNENKEIISNIIFDYEE